MKTQILLVVCVFMCSGCGKSEEDRRREQAQLGMDRFVSAVMSQNPERLRGMLSKEQIETVQRRAKSAGQTVDATLLLEYESQKRGLIMNFGEEWLSKNTLKVADVKKFGEDLFAVSISFRDETPYGKDVYFALEDDEFKFAGITPPLPAPLYAVTADANFWWNHWHFHNYVADTFGAGFWCSDATYDNVAFIANLGDGPLMGNVFDLNPASCFVYEYWYGAKKTRAKVRTYADNIVWLNCGTAGWCECMYNAVGVDIKVDMVFSGALWTRQATCTFP